MGRSPCGDKLGIKKGPWTQEEDQILISYVEEHGPGNWRSIPTKTGLMRCSESCRLRWTNCLRVHEMQQEREMNNPILEKAIQGVNRAYELSNQLHSIFELHPIPGNRGTEMGAIIQGLLPTLAATLSILRSCHDTHVGDRDDDSPELGLASSSNQMVESSGKSVQFLDTTPQNHRRQEKTNNKRDKESWTRITSMPYVDGYEWRKYGKKAIYNSQYSRSYYRCTHKVEKNCNATKNIQQKDSQDPPTFIVTYANHHTCFNNNTINTAATTPELMVGTPPESAEPFTIILTSDSQVAKQQDHHSASPLVPEYCGGTVSPRISATPSSGPTASQSGPTNIPFLPEIGEWDIFSLPSSPSRCLMDNLTLNSMVNLGEPNTESPLDPQHSGEMVSPRIGGKPSSPTASQVGPMLGPLLSGIGEVESFSLSNSHKWMDCLMMDSTMMDSPRLDLPSFEFEDLESLWN